MPNQLILQYWHSIDCAEPGGPQRSQQSGRAEQSIQSIERSEHQEVRTLARTLISLQDALIARILPFHHGCRDLPGELRGIRKAEIHALPCQRVNAVCRIPRQYQPRSAVVICMSRDQRQCCAFAVQTQTTKYATAGICQSPLEFVRMLRHPVLRFATRQRPDYRTPAVGQRQQRERSARQKPLPCGFLVRPLWYDVGDDRMLSIIAFDAL
jgi:hypothetical protein